MGSWHSPGAEGKESAGSRMHKVKPSQKQRWSCALQGLLTHQETSQDSAVTLQLSTKAPQVQHSEELR